MLQHLDASVGSAHHLPTEPNPRCFEWDTRAWMHARTHKQSRLLAALCQLFRWLLEHNFLRQRVGIASIIKTSFFIAFPSAIFFAGSGVMAHAPAVAQQRVAITASTKYFSWRNSGTARLLPGGAATCLSLTLRGAPAT